MSDSMTVQLRVVKGSSGQFRIELSPTIHSFSSVMARAFAASDETERHASRIGWMGALRFIGGVR